MKTRTLIVDGSYLLKRSFHGAKDNFNSKGIDIGALYGFFTKIRELIKEHQINKVLICWDGENGGKMRHYIDPDYKSNRKTKEWYNKIELNDYEIRKEKEKEQSILVQKLRIQDYAEHLFLRQIEIDEIEADDLIAAYCYEYNNKEELYLFSNDRDFAQLLVDLNITILFGNIKTPITKTNYIMHFDHHYSNALILKVLCGDTSDNIKGIKGLGEETLLKHFPELKYKHLTVREICKLADDLNKERIKNKKKPLKVFETLLENIPRLKTNFKLTNLKEPMLNEEAITALDELHCPLSTNDRGGKYLLPMMKEDGFLDIYGSTYVQYIEPFYTVYMHEKDYINECNIKARKNNEVI